MLSWSLDPKAVQRDLFPRSHGSAASLFRCNSRPWRGFNAASPPSRPVDAVHGGLAADARARRGVEGGSGGVAVATAGEKALKRAFELGHAFTQVGEFAGHAVEPFVHLIEARADAVEPFLDAVEPLLELVCPADELGAEPRDERDQQGGREPGREGLHPSSVARLLFRLRDVDAEDLVVGDMALPDASAGDDVLAGDLADIFGIDLDPADSGAAAARQRTTGRRRPRRGRPRRTGAPPAGFQPTARRVAELRHQGGFSVPEFAGLLRVSASTVYRWEAARGPLALRVGQEDALQVLYRAIEKRQT